MAGKLIEFPFDTVKVLLQADPGRYEGGVDCARRIMSARGVWGFYRARYGWKCRRTGVAAAGTSLTPPWVADKG